MQINLNEFTGLPIKQSISQLDEMVRVQKTHYVHCTLLIRPNDTKRSLR